MTIAEMRTLLGLGDEVSDAQVVEAYAAYLGVAGDDETPPELVSLAFAKKHLRLEADDTSEDDLVAFYLGAAIDALDGPDGWLSRALIERAYVQILDAAAGAAKLPYPPIVSVSAIEVQGDGNAWIPLASADWRVDGRKVVLGSGVLPGMIRATYRAGYDPAAGRPLPRSLVSAVLLMLENFYQHRGETGPAAIGKVPLTTTLNNLLATLKVYD